MKSMNDIHEGNIEWKVCKHCPSLPTFLFVLPETSLEWSLTNHLSLDRHHRPAVLWWSLSCSVLTQHDFPDHCKTQDSHGHGSSHYYNFLCCISWQHISIPVPVNSHRMAGSPDQKRVWQPRLQQIWDPCIEQCEKYVWQLLMEIVQGPHFRMLVG